MQTRRVGYTTLAGLERSRATLAGHIRLTKEEEQFHGREAKTVTLLMADAEQLLKRLDKVLESPVVSE